MATVKREFTYYDDGCFPTVHAVGEVVAGEVEVFAISQGHAGEVEADEPEGMFVHEFIAAEQEKIISLAESPVAAPAKRGSKSKGK